LDIEAKADIRTSQISDARGNSPKQPCMAKATIDFAQFEQNQCCSRFET
jgi:hypothetical protein